MIKRYYIKENYSQVKANIMNWVKNCDDEPGAQPPTVEHLNRLKLTLDTQVTGTINL